MMKSVSGAKKLLVVSLIFLITVFNLGWINAAGPAIVNLGTAGDFVILSESGISNTGTTLITGDIGVSPISYAAITGFTLIPTVPNASTTFTTSSFVTGKVYAADYNPPTPVKMTTAISDMQTAYTDAAGRTLPDYTELYAGDITGRTLTPGLYKWGTDVLISAGGVTLSGGLNDVWIFQIAQDLDVANGAIITLSGGAQAKNIFWQVGGQATLGTTSIFNGNILSQTAIVLNTGATLNGRALSQTAVTLDANAVTLDETPDVTLTINSTTTGYTNNANVNLYLNSTIIPDEMRFSLNNVAWTSWTSWGGLNSTNYILSLVNPAIGGNSSDGTKTVYIEVRNYANNIKSDSEFIILDRTLPTLTSTQINGGYSSTNRISPKNLDGKYDSLTIIMNSSESVNWGRTRIYNSTLQEIKYFNGPSGYVTSNVEIWDGNTSSGLYALDGTYTVYTNLTDNAENSNNMIYVGSIIIDNTPPTGTITRDTPIISIGDLTQGITINYNEPMDTSYRPKIDFTNNTGAIINTSGSWITNQQWVENFLVVDADEETTNITIKSSFARDLVGNTEGTSISISSFSIDTKAPVISNTQVNASDIEINNDNDVTISAQIIEGMSGISNVWLEGNWTGSSVNYSLSLVGGYYSYLINKNQFSNQEYVGWRFYARDNLGNIRSTNINTFLIQNREPQFTPSVNNMSWIEDGGSNTINLSNYFYDLDKDNVNYTAVVVSTPGPTSDPNPLGGITVNINNITKIATISSTSDWNGVGTIVFYAWDFVGEYNRSNTVYITVLADDNEVPTLTSSVSPINFSEDETITFQLFCNPNDPIQKCLNYRYDSNYINYSSNLIVNIVPSPVNTSLAQVTLSTKLDWNGITYVKLLVDDDGTILQTGSLIIKVNVTPVNDNPILDAPDVNMRENDPALSPINLLTYTTDVDNVLGDMIYNFVSQSNTSLINCSLNVNTINCGAPAYNKYGISDLIITVEDGDGGIDTQKITIDVKKNHAPIIQSYSPTNNPSIKTGNSQTFVLISRDSDNITPLNYVWKVDGVVSQSGVNNNFVYTPTSNGNFVILVEISDDAPNTVTHTWSLTSSNYPVATEFNGDDTTNLSLVADLSNVQNLVLENQYGKIEFLSPVDLTNAWDLNSNVEIAKGLVAINTQAYSSLNKPAKITLYGLTYSSIPKIYYTTGFTLSSSGITNECSNTQCNMLNYTDFSTTNGEVIFNVLGFSSYSVKGSGMIYDLNKLDIDACEEGVKGNLSLEIKNPDKDDSFKPGEEIKVEVKVKNEGEDDDKFIVEGILYNFDEDEEIETEESDSIEIESGDSKTFEFTIIVPEDFEEEDDYFLFVKAYQKGEEESQCNYQTLDLDLEREEHEVIIQNIMTTSQVVYTNEKLNMEIELKNIGSSDEDAYVKITNSELGISQKSETFEIEEYGEDDEIILSESLNIPYGVASGEYSLKVEVFFEDGSSSTLYKINIINTSLPIVPQNIIKASSSSGGSSKTTTSTKPIVASKSPLTGETISKKIVAEEVEGLVKVSVSSEEKQTFVEQKSTSSKNKYAYIIAGLFVGIIVFTLLITLVWMKKR